MKQLVRFFFFLICLHLHLETKAQYQVSGIVTDRELIPISGVSISVNDQTEVTTDNKGKFIVNNYRGGKPESVKAFKDNMQIASWSFYKGKLEIVMRKTSYYLLEGNAFFTDNKPCFGHKIDYYEGSTLVKSSNIDSEGYFRIIIPSSNNNRYSASSKFLLDDIEISPDNISYNRTRDFATVYVDRVANYTRIGKLYSIDIKDTSGISVDGLIVNVNGVEHRTNIQGRFVAKNTAGYNEGIKIRGYEILQIDSSLQKNTLYVTVHPKKQKPVKNNTPITIIDTIKKEEEEPPVVIDTVSFERPNSYYTQINDQQTEEEQALVKQITSAKEEQEELKQQSTELQENIEQLSKELSNDDLSEDLRQQIENQLAQLRKALQTNKEEYLRIQAVNKKLVDDLKLSLLDSEDRYKLSEAQREKEAEEFRNRIILILCGVAILFLLIAFLSILIKRVKKQKNEIVETQKELQGSYQQIKVQNKKITDSIRYAQTIQEAILPTSAILSNTFKEYFIMFKPKDIVSGDFFWYTEFKHKGVSYHYIAAVDCTGHGVPGAFMSMIGSIALKEAVHNKSLINTNEIIEDLHNNIVELLKQEESENDDGMDLCICRLDQLKNGETRLQFTGAKRPLLMVRKNLPHQLGIIKGDNRTVGGLRQKRTTRKSKRKNTTSTKPRTPKLTPFKEKTFYMREGDGVYLTTDGYIDQINNEKEKFGTKKMIDILKDTALETLENQQQILEKEFQAFKKTAEQRDDITIIGLRF